MKTLIRATLVFLLFGLLSQMVRADDYDDAINSFKNAGESGAYFEKSIGYAVFPTIGKGGLIGVGGAHGRDHEPVAAGACIFINGGSNADTFLFGRLVTKSGLSFRQGQVIVYGFRYMYVLDLYLVIGEIP